MSTVHERLNKVFQKKQRSMASLTTAHTTNYKRSDYIKQHFCKQFTKKHYVLSKRFEVKTQGDTL